MNQTGAPTAIKVRANKSVFIAPPPTTNVATDRASINETKITVNPAAAAISPIAEIK